MNRTLLLLCAPALLIATCKADFLFTNVTNAFPGDAVSTTFSSFAFLDFAFTTTSGGALGQIDLVSNSGPSGGTMGLYTDLSGAPGTLLESWDYTVPTDRAPLTLVSVDHPQLDSSVQYWLVSNRSTGGFTEFNNNDTSAFTTTCFGATAGDTCLSLLAAGLQVEAVPEPSSIALASVGAFALFAFRRLGKRRPGV